MIQNAVVVKSNGKRRRAPKPKSKGTTCSALRSLFNIFLLLAIIVAVIVVLTQYADQLFGSDVDLDLDPSEGTVFLGNETRNGDDYVGLFLSAELAASPDASAAFIDAAARWSAILDGNVINDEVINAGNLCGGTFFANESFVLDHLAIGAALIDIDGVGGILGNAGPCNLDTTDGFPVFGQMRFDAADINDLFNDGTLTDVILHEMGHVLGIGTLWNRAVQGEISLSTLSVGTGLLKNQVLSNNGQTILNTVIQPTFEGDEAEIEFEAIGGTVGGVPVEDGRDELNNIISGAASLIQTAGSTDGHWEQEVFGDELMTFQIGAGSAHPLSRVTIASLQDMGYIVDFAQADTFNSLVSRKRSIWNLRGSKKVHTLKNDIIMNLGN